MLNGAPDRSRRYISAHASGIERGARMSMTVDPSRLDAWTREGELLEKAVEEAAELLGNYPDGISEGVLVDLLKERLEIRLRLASAAIDQLESSGRARKNWATGFLSPTC